MKSLIATVFASVFVLAACEDDESSMEEAAEEMEEAAEDATDGR